VVKITERCSPGPAARVYAEYYPRYRALYPALTREFTAISDVATRP
jgi:hypothetical protein